jgi:hypothetical protein
LGLAIAVGVALFGIAAVVQAGITDSQGQIHGCYNSKGSQQTNGTTLNIIDSASSCAKGQAPITWNQRGVTGATGLTGPSGPSGPAGTTALYYASTTGPLVNSGNSGTAIADCPHGHAIGGGFGVSTGKPWDFMYSSPEDLPGGSKIAWYVEAVNNTGGSGYLTAYVICTDADIG